MQTHNIECLDKFEPLLTTQKRVKILIGGRSSTKSTFVADAVASFMASGQLWCCGREYQNSIEESVHRLLTDEIERIGLEGFTISKTDISHVSGGRDFYRGLARNPLSLKGIMSGIDGLWIEEGEGLSETTLRILTASVRLTAKEYDAACKEGLFQGLTLDEAIENIKQPEIWITMNRGSRKDAIITKYVARAEKELSRCGFYEDDNVMIVQSHWTDMPKSWWLASGLESERKDDKERMTAPEYAHKWDGDYLETVQGAIIQQQWFDACVDAHIKLGIEPLGAEVVSHDPSDDGKDAAALAHSHGIVFKEVMEGDYNDVNDSCDWATGYANEVKADAFVWDGGGMGLGLKKDVSRAFDGKKVDTYVFLGQETADHPDRPYMPIEDDKKKTTNKQAFFNQRAQYYGFLRDAMYRTYLAVVKKKYMNPDDLVSFSSNITHLNQLKSELCMIPKKPNGSGRFQVLSKEEMAKLDLDSPNLADVVMMARKAIYSAKTKKKHTPIKYETLL